jgi:hypothetical protein
MGAWTRRTAVVAILLAVSPALEACTSLLGVTDITGAGEDGGSDGTASGDWGVARAPESGSESQRPGATSDATPDVSAPDSGTCQGSACVSGCEVGGVPYTTNAPDPDNACQSCQPGTSVTAWTPIADGSGCGNGQICIAGACGTECDVRGTVYASGAANPTNACESCQPGTTATAWTDDAPGTSCGAGEVCSASSCAAGCFIGGTVYAPNAVSPASTCQLCVPAASTTAWTTGADGTTCGPGQVCNASSCAAGCFVAGSFYAPSAANPSNACQTCQPGASPTAWTAAGTGASCGEGQVCTASICGAGCYIGGTVYASAAPNPADACQTCQPGQSTSAWSSAADGVTCGNGQVCASGACGTQCDIGGTLYASGAANPSNACQSCQPGTSTAAWTAVTSGTSCASGEVCNATSCVAACYIGGAFYGVGAQHDGVDERREWDRLRHERRVQRSELRRGLLHRGDGVRVGRAEPGQPLPELPAGCERDGVDEPRQRDRVWSGRSVQRVELRRGLLHRGHVHRFGGG